MGARLVAVMMVAVVLAGPMQGLALAQQPSQASPSQSSEPQPALYQGGTQAQPARRSSRGTDFFYDVGAGAMTGVGMPLKGLSCALSVVVAFGLFVATVGSADRATAAVVEEGCDQRWIVRGRDIRPQGESSARLREMYDGGVR